MYGKFTRFIYVRVMDIPLILSQRLIFQFKLNILQYHCHGKIANFISKMEAVYKIAKSVPSCYITSTIEK